MEKTISINKDKSIYSIVKSALLTEKATDLTPLCKYIFKVAVNANKIEIKRAIEKIYNVKVETVSTMIMKGRIKKLRANQVGRIPSWKKAIVTLKKGQEIKLA